MFALLIIASIVGIVLKMTEVIDWPWAVALIPVWCLAAFMVIWVITAATGAALFRRQSKKIDREFRSFGRRR